MFSPQRRQNKKEIACQYLSKTSYQKLTEADDNAKNNIFTQKFWLSEPHITLKGPKWRNIPKKRHNMTQTMMAHGCLENDMFSK